ncbi:DUF1203 domain-containing protein [Massilia sp. ST3]|uniref:DUF1203 domain-containing protein n=1 Tax=Massilia sp. ST3 TaxID=2824903 RepID=UPI001B837E96|nr:DUF1203 domain-containing protein [Massilia sp. ST3]MBQ5946523.1 DUF1203 domain-containing protein [Massilia sp. ST3]
MQTISAPATPIRIVPLPFAYLERARAGVDDLGQPVERHVAQGGEPLRDLLRRAEPGEAILLASYCPFTQAGPFREYGPVFLSAAGQGAAPPGALPFEGETPYLGASFVLRAYSASERIVDARVSSPDAAAGDLDALFARADTDFVLARFTAYGCYALRIERAAPAGAGMALRR